MPRYFASGFVTSANVLHQTDSPTSYLKFTPDCRLGLTHGLSFKFPATQEVFAEAIGTSSVHVNRVIQELRAQGVLDFARGAINILDEEKLRTQADFDSLYLHLDPSL